MTERLVEDQILGDAEGGVSMQQVKTKNPRRQHWTAALCVQIVFVQFVLCAATAHGAWVFTVTAPRIQQADENGCGAATAKMIVESDPVDGDEETLAQYQTDIERERQDTWWKTADPYAEHWVIEEYDTRVGFIWPIFQHTDVKEAAGKLAWTFWKYGTPSATLVEKGDRWVAVVGIKTDVEPGPTESDCFTVERVTIHDPEDGKKKQISYETWSKSWQTPIPADASTGYAGKMINVCDPPEEWARCILDYERDPPCGGRYDCPLTRDDALALAPTLVTEEGLDADFTGWVAKEATHVSISHTTDTAWWVGFGPDDATSQVCAGILIDDDQSDLLLASWAPQGARDVGCADWDTRREDWPYLTSDRIPTAVESTDQSDLFYIHDIGSVGACCVEGYCVPNQDLAPDECLERGGIYHGDGTTCEQSSCRAIIPTVSEWGLVVMLLLVLAAGTIVIRRRRAAVA